MKLRNKKTGEIGDFIGTNKAVPYISISIDYHDGNPVVYEYDSLEALNEEWEDYQPTEPLIEDEKIRKAVRAWAEVEGETQVLVSHCRRHILSIWSGTRENGNIDFDCDIKPFDEGYYTIAELCGEEEE